MTYRRALLGPGLLQPLEALAGRRERHSEAGVLTLVPGCAESEEPGPYPTDWPGASAVNSDPDPLYDGVRQAQLATWAEWEHVSVAAHG